VTQYFIAQRFYRIQIAGAIVARAGPLLAALIARRSAATERIAKRARRRCRLRLDGADPRQWDRMARSAGQRTRDRCDRVSVTAKRDRACHRVLVRSCARERPQRSRHGLTRIDPVAERTERSVRSRVRESDGTANTLVQLAQLRRCASDTRARVEAARARNEARQRPRLRRRSPAGGRESRARAPRLDDHDVGRCRAVQRHSRGSLSVGDPLAPSADRAAKGLRSRSDGPALLRAKSPWIEQRYRRGGTRHEITYELANRGGELEAVAGESTCEDDPRHFRMGANHEVVIGRIGVHADAPLDDPRLALDQRDVARSRPNRESCGDLTRVSPCELPSACGGANRSTPSTFSPAAAIDASATAPMTPVPTTIASHIVRGVYRTPAADQLTP